MATVKIETVDGVTVYAEMTPHELHDFIRGGDARIPAPTASDMPPASDAPAPSATITATPLPTMPIVALGPVAQLATLLENKNKNALEQKPARKKKTVERDMPFKFARHDIITIPAVYSKDTKTLTVPRGQFFCGYCDEPFETPGGRGVHESAHRRHPRKMRKVHHGVKKQLTPAEALQRALDKVQQANGMSDADKESILRLSLECKTVKVPPVPHTLQDSRREMQAMLDRLNT